MNLTQANTANVGTLSAITQVIANTLAANTQITTPVLYVSSTINATSIHANSSIETYDSLVNNNLTVKGNFIIVGTTIYDSDAFNLKGGSPITGTAKASFGVNRQSGLPTFTPNAQIQWDNSDGGWKLRDITGADANAYFRIVTEKYTANTNNAGIVQLNDSNTSTSVTLAATANSVNNIPTPVKAVLGLAALFIFLKVVKVI